MRNPLPLGEYFPEWSKLKCSFSHSKILKHQRDKQPSLSITLVFNISVYSKVINMLLRQKKLDALLIKRLHTIFNASPRYLISVYQTK